MSKFSFWDHEATPATGCCGGWGVGLCGLGVCGCSGGVLLSRSLVGAVPLALGGLASGFGMGPGVSLPRCGRRDGGGVVVLGLAPPLWGVGGLVLGCVVDAGGGVCWVVCVVRVGLLVPVG